MISIIVPAHNEKHFLPGLFQSLKTHYPHPLEIVVVDNGSSDGTSTIASDFGCKLVSLDQKVFPSVARNIGVANSSGDLLVFLDADVEVTAQWGDELFRRQGEITQGGKIITGDQYHISKSPSWIERYWFKPLRSKQPSYINGGNLLTNRATFNAIDGFDEALETGEDVDFCKRAVSAGARMIINTQFVALHEGYPKTIRRFVKRERWHGVGDFQSLRTVIASKVAVATVVFLLLNFLLAIVVVGAVMGSGTGSAFLHLIFALVCLCAISSLHRFRAAGWRYIVYGIPTTYLYYWGRSLSLFDVIRARLGAFN